MGEQGNRPHTMGKARQLWQIFFDDDKPDEGAGSGKFKPTVLLDKSRAGRSHGVLYKGITDAESGSDSDEEITQGLHGLPSGEQLTRGLFGSATGQDAGDLLFKDQEKFMFAKSAVVPNGNSIQNYNKPFNAREWESVEITPGPSRPKSQRLSQHGGARFIIRSESDLELAIPANQRPKRRHCCCFPDKGSQSQTFEYGVCVLLAFVTMAAVYVAIVICIVYGFK